MSKIESTQTDRTPLLQEHQRTPAPKSSIATALTPKRRALEENSDSKKRFPRLKKLNARLKFWKKGGAKKASNQKSALSNSLSGSRESLTSSYTRNRLSNLAAAHAPLAPAKPTNYDEAAQSLVSQLLKNEQTNAAIKKQFFATQEKQATEIDVVMLGELAKANDGNMEVAGGMLEQIKAGESIDKVAPNFKYKKEFKALQDTQKFVEHLEANEQKIVDILLKAEENEAGVADRLTLSTLLRQGQADIGIAHTHIQDVMASHMKQANGDVKIAVMISLEAMKQRIAVRGEIINSFAGRYADFLPDITPFHSLDGDRQNLINLSALSEALQANSSILKEEGNTQDAQKLDAANLTLQERRGKIDKSIDTKKTAIEGAHNVSKRLSRKLSQEVKPISFKLDLPPELMPTKEQIALGRSLVLNKMSWPEVSHGNSFWDAGRKEYIYTSILTPASAANGVAKQMAPSYEGSASVQSIANIHVPNLATVQLQNGSGRTIYASTRHAALDPSGINQSNFLNLSTQNAQLVLARGNEGNVKLAQNMTRLYGFLRTDPQANMQPAFKAAQIEVADNMANELVKTQLLSDEVLYRQALSISTPYDEATSADMQAMVLPMNTINLMGKSNDGKRKVQLDALHRIANKGKPVIVQIVGEDGRVRNVAVQVKLREFNFNLASRPFSLRRLFRPTPSAVAAEEWGYRPTSSNQALSSLVGKKGSKQIGGEVGERIKQFDEAIAAGVKIVLEEREVLNARPQDDDAIRQAVRNASAKQKEVDELKAARVRFAAPAEQLKEIWRSGKFTSNIGDNNKFTARLSLLCSELGSPAIISDINGMDRVNSCDAEAQYLAAQLNTNGFATPPDSGEDKIIRDGFFMSGGAVELRRYNDGLVN